MTSLETTSISKVLCYIHFFGRIEGLKGTNLLQYFIEYKGIRRKNKVFRIRFFFFFCITRKTNEYFFTYFNLIETMELR